MEMEKRLKKLRRQLRSALARGMALGEKRHEVKRTPEGKRKIHSTATRSTYEASAWTFVRWCAARYGVERLVDIKSHMVEAYFTEQLAAGRQPSYLKKVRSAIMKL